MTMKQPKQPPRRQPIQQPQPKIRQMNQSPPASHPQPTQPQPAPLRPGEPSPTLVARLWPNGWAKTGMPAWVVLPLRLFLGVTFMYAGIQKLTDPQYFRPSAPGYIGKQIMGFATGSPIHGLLVNIALPHATLFGWLIAWGELAIGFGVLIGLLVRPAAFFGALLSLVFFLSASWRVHPYFYGSDIVFLFGWSVIVLAGPIAGGWPVFDAWLAAWLRAHVPTRHQVAVNRLCWVLLGVSAAPDVSEAATHAGAHAAGGHGSSNRRQPGRRAVYSTYARAQTRRDFLKGAAAGVAGALGLVYLISLLRSGDTTNAPLPASTAPAGSSGSATAGTSSATGATIAEVSQVPANSAAMFTVPSSGDPGVVVHLNSGNFVAFDAICTHAGCTVQYDPGSQLLLCPCHGAAFDPAHSAQVVQGPAPTPLASVPIQVNQATGAITTNG